MASNSSKFDAVVVIGGGFAGLTTLLALSQCKNRPPLVLIEPSSRFVFLPLLYELLSGEMQISQVAPSYKAVLKDRGIVFIQDHVDTIDVNAKQVITVSGLSVNYAKVVIATGSIPNDLGVRGLVDNAFTFHTLEDVDRLKNRINEIKSCKDNSKVIVVVGAGATGVELACKLYDLLDSQTQIHLFDLGKKVLPYGKNFNRIKTQDAIAKRNIKVHLETRVLEISSDKVSFESYQNQEIKTDSLLHKALIWTAGNRPSAPNLLKILSSNQRKILVDEYLQVVGLKDVFALGDTAYFENDPLPANAQVAIQQGHSAAKILMAFREGEIPKKFQFFDYGEMLSLGVDDAAITSLGFTFSGFLASRIRKIIYWIKIQRILFGSLLTRDWFLRN